jgi:hypothetical protein
VVWSSVLISFYSIQTIEVVDLKVELSTINSLVKVLKSM